MQLHDVRQVAIPRKHRMRVGRGIGSGKGKTAGKGTKGQQSRSGYSAKRGHEGGQNPLWRRLPKRGFTNARFKVDYDVVNLCTLNEFDAGSVVDLAVLKERGLITKSAKLLKVLAQGTLDRALTVRAHAFSAKATEAITAASGTAETVGGKG
ncbi:MAG: 50S ribosomal protein L15 [Planctomycetes bacterium]|nr:50S ribosomal protein L15 [Planctomycetota bacterium]